ncbi:MAG TPA: glycoside hydrolase family 95 protein, partial [Chitinophagaceae bacterium]
GGFEVVSLHWKDGKVIKAVIRSKLGGNLRLRVPNSLKLTSAGLLMHAASKNTNPFYETEETPDPIVSPGAAVTPPELKETFLYDVDTQKGKVYTFLSQEAVL